MVRRIYERRAAGQSLNGIVRELNQDGIPSPGRIRYLRGLTKTKKFENALWIRGTVRKILQNPAYIGCRVHGIVKRIKVGQKKERRPKEEWQIIEGAHPAIISRELFELVQKINYTYIY